MTEILAQLLQALDGNEARLAVYLLLGELRPKFNRLETNLADRMVVRGLAETFEVPVASVWGEYKKVGDLGTVGEKFKSQNSPLRQGYEGQANLKAEEISITQVYEKLIELAKESGEGSQNRKLLKLTALIEDLDPLSVRYVLRMVVGKLRLGFSDMTILDALAVMDRGSKKGREELELSYQVFPDVGELARLVKEKGITGVGKSVGVTLGAPVVPALCQRLKSAKEMIEKMGTIYMEPKFDGTRVQIHFSRAKNGEARSTKQEARKDEFTVKTFSRTLDETTWMFPEMRQIGQYIQADEVILDSEAIGMDPKTGKMRPFQETITRKRKHEIDDVSARIPLKFMVFDILYLNGRSLIELPLSERRKLLEQTVKSGGPVMLVEAIETHDPTELRAFHQRQLELGMEGAVVKQVNSVYEPGRRGWSWVKFKEAETSQAKLADTIDVVVMGFYRGRGKRAKFGIGAFLVGIRADQTARLVTLAKIGTGLTDEQWRELKQRLDEVVAMEQPKSYLVAKGLWPDVWVDPKVVVEVAADEVTKSPIHTAGVALRFPRLVRFRDDKSVAELTTLDELRQMQ